MDGTRETATAPGVEERDVEESEGTRSGHSLAIYLLHSQRQWQPRVGARSPMPGCYWVSEGSVARVRGEDLWNGEERVGEDRTQWVGLFQRALWTDIAREGGSSAAAVKHVLELLG